MSFYPFLLAFTVIIISVRQIFASNKSSVKQECFDSNANDDCYKRFYEHLNRRNNTHYSPIMPLNNQALLKISETELRNGQILSYGNSSARIRRNLTLIISDTPMNERSLCPFDYVLNYNPLRMPSILISATCTQRYPPQKLNRNRKLECQSLQYKIRVIMFDEKCDSFQEQEETISLACIPVLKAEAAVEDHNSHDNLIIAVDAKVS